MFRYRLHSPAGDDLGEATYAMMIRRCGLPLIPGTPFDLDHADSGIGYLGVSHRRCKSWRSVQASGWRRAAADPQNSRVW